MIMDTSIITDPKVQARIEIVLSNVSGKQYQKICKLGAHIRKNVLDFRQRSMHPAVEDLIDFLKSSAEKFGFTKPEISFYEQTVTNDVIPLTIFKFLFGNINGFIHIVSL